GGLGFVVWGLVHRFGRFPAPRAPQPLAFRFHLGSPLALGLRVSFRPRFQTAHGRLDRRQAVCTARQLGRQFIAPPAAQSRLVLGVFLVGLHHHGPNVFPQGGGFLAI